MNRGEIWWVTFDRSVGGEVQKGRPAIIVSNDASNRHLNRVQVVPITSRVERIYPSESPVVVGKRVGKAMADQLTTVSKTRLLRIVGRASLSEMRALERAMKVQLALT